MLITPRPLRRHAALLTGLTAAAFIGMLCLSFGNAVLQAQTDTGTGAEVIAETDSSSSSAKASTPAASKQTVALTLRPHCEKKEQQRCPLFMVTSPLNLETSTLSVGDTLDMDILEQNVRKLSVGKIRAWLTYDPTILEGTSVVPSTSYPIVTPGEQEFDAENGYVKVEVQPGNGTNTGALAPVAQVTFTIKSIPEGGTTVIGFYDASGEEPHTAVYDSSETPANILSKNLGSLSVRINTEQIATVDPVTEEETIQPMEEDIVAQDSAPSDESASSSSKAEEDPPSDNSDATPPDPPAEVEQPVVVPPSKSEHPAAEEFSSSSEAATEPMTVSSETTFSLLQVQNVRVTSVDGSLYVAWDLLAAPGLQGYYVYYGTDTGRYIQRRGVASAERSTAIYGLPDGTPYYVAVRGVKESGEETAFSTEVAVTIGDARTSTSPLSQRDVPVGTNRVKSGQATQVPGESGTPSILIVLLILSAIIGTFLAFRRQTAVLHAPSA